MSIRVLIADDHAIVLDGLCATLGSAPDLEVVAQARDGEEAVRRASDLSPDVAVLDILMPEMNGIDATQSIRRNCPECRVVILSARTGSEFVYRALRAGADGYVAKLAETAEIVQAVRAVHGGKRYLSKMITDSIVEDIVTSDAPWNPLELLSGREKQILQQILERRTSADIASRLDLSVKTVDTYRSRLMHKLGIGDIQQLVKFAIRHGLTSLD